MEILNAREMVGRLLDYSQNVLPRAHAMCDFDMHVGPDVGPND